MEKSTLTGLVTGEITALSDTHATVTDERGALWQVPRSNLNPAVRQGDHLTLCALSGGIAQREAFVRELLNQLLSGR